MKFKKLFYLSLLLSSTYTYAAHEGLTNYEMIKQYALNGSTIKMVVDVKDCKVLDDDTDGGPPISKNIFVSTLTDFSIKEKTKYIMTDVQSFMGIGDENYTGNVQESVTYITPDNEVILIDLIMALPSYKRIKYNRFLCPIGNENSVGVKFFVV